MATAILRSRFRPTEKVSAYVKTTDRFRLGAAGDPVQVVEADGFGHAEFTDLDEGPYWISGEDDPERGIAVTAKEPALGSSHHRVPPELAGQTRSGGRRGSGVTQGARDSESLKDAARKRG